MDRLPFCDHCVVGKYHGLLFGVCVHCSNGPLDYIHSDLWGPAQTMSHGGSRYMLTLIDDFSRRVWVYTLRSKDQVFSSFKEWKNLVENQTGKKVKRLRTDNGLEFCSKVFNDFCAKAGIVRHHTVVHTPQQNGVAERMNRTLIEKVRCMLSSSGLSKDFWAEAVTTAAYLVNRSPHSGLDGRTPMEIWSGSPPTYSNLRVFGCPAYAHIRQGKLDPRSLKCIFLGYGDGVKGYRLWYPSANGSKGRLVISRDVIFDEASIVHSRVESIRGSSSRSEGLNNEDRGSRSSSRVVTFQLPGRTSDVEKLPKNSDVIPEAPLVEVEGDRNGYDAARGESIGARAAREESSSAREENTSAREESVVAREDNIATQRARREIRPPKRYAAYAEEVAYALVCAGEVEADEPGSYREAIEGANAAKWNHAMIEEMDSLRKNKTWDLAVLPKGRKAIGCKWIFKVKDSGSVEAPKYKARLVAKGFSQKEGIDFHEIFSPVVRLTSIRVILALSALHDLELHQMDVKTAFLHGKLEEEIYMEQPQGFEIQGKENLVCRLRKSLYGLKQSPRCWYHRFDTFISSHGFVRSKYDSCVYVKGSSSGSWVYLLLYVDDMLIAARDMAEVNRIKEILSSEFEMKDLGEAKKILGLEIQRDRPGGTLFLSQSSYIKKVLDRFGMIEAKPVSTPLGHHDKVSSQDRPTTVDEQRFMDRVPYARAVGSIMYAMICTRPDIAHAVSVVSRYMANPGKAHWNAVKWILRYLRGTQDMGILFRKGIGHIVGYTDSDYAGDLDKRKSLSGYLFTLGSGPVSWKATLQSTVALSTTEAEYIALAEGFKEALWMRGLLNELDSFTGDSVVYCDSQSAIHLAKNQVFHERSKHIDVRLHFIREVIEEGVVRLEKVSTEENPTDMLTKSLSVSKFSHCLKLISIEEKKMLGIGSTDRRP